jgi:hypothetical protein
MNELSANDIQIKFRDTLVDFLDELITNYFPTETELIFMRMIVKQAPVADLLGRFMRDLLPLKQFVIEKNDEFFLNNTLLYIDAKISSEKENHFKSLWTSNILDEDDRNTIWEWMHSFIRISELYEENFGYIPGWEK